MSRLGKVAVMNDPAFSGKRQGSTKGDVVMEDLDEEGGDAYVKIHHVDKVSRPGGGRTHGDVRC